LQIPPPVQKQHKKQQHFSFTRALAPLFVVVDVLVNVEVPNSSAEAATRRLSRVVSPSHPLSSNCYLRRAHSLPSQSHFAIEASLLALTWTSTSAATLASTGAHCVCGLKGSAVGFSHEVNAARASSTTRQGPENRTTDSFNGIGI